MVKQETKVRITRSMKNKELPFQEIWGTRKQLADIVETISSCEAMRKGISKFLSKYKCNQCDCPSFAMPSEYQDLGVDVHFDSDGFFLIQVHDEEIFALCNRIYLLNYWVKLIEGMKEISKDRITTTFFRKGCNCGGEFVSRDEEIEEISLPPVNGLVVPYPSEEEKAWIA